MTHGLSQSQADSAQGEKDIRSLKTCFPAIDVAELPVERLHDTLSENESGDEP